MCVQRQQQQQQQQRRWRPSCGSVDTLDCTPAPALPPRRQAWPSLNSRSSSSSSIISSSETTTLAAAATVVAAASTGADGSGNRTGSFRLRGVSTGSSSGDSSIASFVELGQIAATRLQQPPVLTPPSYPAPPRPPTRNGGDEARVARAGGSGCGASCCTLAHGTPMPRALPPRAAATSSSSSNSSDSNGTTKPGTAVNCWTLSHASATTPASLGPRTPSSQWASHHLHPVQHQQQQPQQQPQQQQQQQPQQQQQQQPHRIAAATTPTAAADALRQQNQWQWHAAPTVLAPPVPADNDNPMSQHAVASPPSRPPSSASSTASSSLSLGSLGGPAPVARVHDHSRPLPPPRILPPPPPPAVTTAITTGSPLATSFRSASRTPLAPDSLVLGSARLIQPPPSPSAAAIAAAGQAAAGEVSLQAPRPDGERVANEYVETPFRPQLQQQQQSNNRPEDSLDGHLKASNHQRTCKSSERRNGKHQHQLPSVHRHHQQQQQRRGNAGLLATTTTAAGQGQQQRPITKQPVSFTKEPGPGNAMLGRAGDGPTSSQGLSIMCERCGRCRCESCREPPPLPSRWLCDNACFCSAETALDYASCLCCVKGLFYHCADGQQHQPGPGSGGGPGSSLDSEPGASCADEPCSCAGPRSLARWTCLSALALVLPCLLCYWPLRGCVALCEACYAKHATQGCRCEPQQLAPGLQALAISGSTAQAALESRDPEKRLLDPIGPDL